MVYGIYAMSFFLPLIVKSLGLSNTAVGYVLVLPSICGSIGMICSLAVPIGPASGSGTSCCRWPSRVSARWRLGCCWGISI